jgi:hypothetical protein
MIHRLKTWPGPFEAIRLGAKKHEIRVNDRGFATGDLLRLEEWDPDTEAYTRRIMIMRATYITFGGQWGLPDNLCVMSIERVER